MHAHPSCPLAHPGKGGGAGPVTPFESLLPVGNFFREGLGTSLPVLLLLELEKTYTK